MIGTLAVHSVENFLQPDELAEVRQAMAAVVDPRRDTLQSHARDHSVHEIKGLTVQETLAVYEPQGRTELVEVPDDVHEVLKAAISRSLPSIQRVYPLVTRADSWFYVEYDNGQFISPHIDYPVDESDPETTKYAAISVTLQQCDTGGEFFVCTTSDERLWQGQRRLPDVTPALDWFGELRLTEWSVRVAPGDALCWGTEMIHGTRPVTAGTAKKLIGLLY